MRFTILGSTGFIGRALLEHLGNEGHECLAPARATPKRGERAVRSMGHVIYCIGVTADFRERAFDTVRAHVCELLAWLELGDFDSFLLLSSTRVYAGVEHASETTSLIVDPSRPDDLYNISKLAGESLCLTLRNPRVRVARLASVVGERADTHDFISALLEAGTRTRSVELQSHPESCKDYVTLDDVVNLLPRIAFSGRHRLYNVASGNALSHGRVASEIAGAAGWVLRTREDTPLVRHPAIDVTRIREEFAYQASDPLAAIAALARRRVAPGISERVA